MITALYLATVMIATIGRGYILQQLWLWFVVPLGMVEISLIHAIGFGMTISFLTQYPTDEDIENNENSSTGQKMYYNLIRLLAYAMTLPIAWVVSLLM
ncbi:hypothetical protein LCGC14_1358940 [marine sediment metagenome]|uniref:Uncharacterized protein n=1 Tax=marine sediment metagenome TaxID=412755 RepID=A0A0F9KUR6_9ZZZZ